MNVPKKSKLAEELEKSGKYPDTEILDLRKRDANKGMKLNGSKYCFILHDTVMVILDPNDKINENDKYILFSADEKNHIIKN